MSTHSYPAPAPVGDDAEYEKQLVRLSPPAIPSQGPPMHLCGCTLFNSNGQCIRCKTQAELLLRDTDAEPACVVRPGVHVAEVLPDGGVQYLLGPFVKVTPADRIQFLFNPMVSLFE